MQQQTKRLRPFAAACAVLGLLAFAAPASADLILGNNLNSGAVGFAADLSPMNNINQWMAVGFAMNPGQDYLLTDVQADIQRQGPNVIGNGITIGSILQMDIWSDNGGALGTQLTSLTRLSGTNGIFDFGPSSAFILHGGTTYWLRAFGSDKQQTRWLALDAFSGGVATYLGTQQTTSAIDFTPKAGVGGGLPGVVITGTPVSSAAVPEPGSLALLGAGLAGWLGKRRRALAR